MTAEDAVLDLVRGAAVEQRLDELEPPAAVRTAQDVEGVYTHGKSLTWEV